jgi:excisionase family DNA binding protein
MEELLTTRQVLEILKVDRITVYRMLQDGRLKGVKIGQQWRFPRREVDQLLNPEPLAPVASTAEPEAVFPTHCVQTIQDLFSDVSQIGALILDRNGEPVTEMSGPRAFCKLMAASPKGQAACRACWKEFASRNAENDRYFTCHAGLSHVGAPIQVKGERIGLFLVGPFTWQPAILSEQTERMRRLASQYDVPADALLEAVKAIPVIAPERQAQLETWPFTAARAVQSILIERTSFLERLRQIADLTQL